jgi:mannosyl-3-phosphoglycerate phosphatase
VRLVIVTDLDGTLLDAQSYGFEPARAALERVKRLGVPLVLCSSKTSAEIDVIQRRIGIADPYVTENGGAIVAPRGYFANAPAWAGTAGDRVTLVLGPAYAEVVAGLKAVAAAEQIRVVGFSDMSVSEVAADCGLPLLDAQLAKLRQHDEPFRLFGADPAARSRFLKAMRRRGLKVVSGGRYDHATGDVDKGRAVGVLRTLFEEERGRVVMVGLGDGLNDMSLLRAVDRAVIVKNDTCEATARLARKVPAAEVTNASGPAGWAEAMTSLLDSWSGGQPPAKASAWRRWV